MKKILLLPFRLLALVTGTISWSAPPWLSGLRGLILAHRRAAGALVVLAAVALGGYLWYDSLPKAVMVKAVTSGVGITPNQRDAKPDSLEIQFDYDFSVLSDGQQRPSGNPSVARIDLVGEEFAEGIAISPSREGRWRWIDDRRIRFEPATDWPADVEYTVSFSPSIFSNKTRLSEDKLQFTTPAFEARIDSIELYQDPIDISVRRVISTVSFTHPVDRESFEERIEMLMRPSGEEIQKPPRSYDFKVTYDENDRQAYVQSEPIELPQDPSYMKLVVADGVRSILGGEVSASAVEDQATVPDLYSFLKVDSAEIRIVRNQHDDPEQLLMLGFTDDLLEAELLGKLSLYLLPGEGEPSGKRSWRSPREVTDTVLANSDRVDYRLVPNERNFSRVFNFVVDLPEGRQLYVSIDQGFKSVNQYVHRSRYDNLVNTPAYPREVKIAGEGSILTYSGEQQLSVATRGLGAVKLVVAKLLPGQINHLVSQTSGDISNPDFINWNFNSENITEIDSLVLQLKQQHPGKANYFSIDLNQYLPRNEARFGLFFVDLLGWDAQREREIRGVADRRLVLVTDLGIIVKNNADRSHDLFVQSIASGEPVAGAEVKLLGKNGIPLFERLADARGHVTLPSTGGFEREQQPTVYVVRSANDLSFIPYDRSSRQINLSRFDIGGVRKTGSGEEALSGFVFSDRGMYRPGETVNLGMIVKQFDMSNIEGIPLEVVIVGPRHGEALVRRVTLPKNGFFEFQFETEATTITGIYYANLHLVRDNERRGRQIASQRFDVEEFQPDTMKISSELLDVDDEGWTTRETLVSKVVLSNLFGSPAQDRKLSGRVVIEPHSFRFREYADYRFTDPHLDPDREPLRLDRQLPDQRTDANGEGRFEIDLADFREGTYRLSFMVEGFEADGGRSVLASNSALLSPLETIVGFKADGDLEYINADSERSIELIAIDNRLARTRADGLTLRLIEIQQISTLVKQPNNTYKYQSVDREVEVSREPLAIGADGFVYAIDTATPGNFALEVISAQDLRLARLEFSVVGYANLAGKIDKSAELDLKLDKEDYFPGETIEMSIRAPYAGAGLITIETDRVHAFKWFRSDAESTLQTIRVPAELEGTGYVNVSFVRDAGAKEIFTSPLSYAVQPFSIDRSKRRIDVLLEAADIVRPGKPMRIGFSTSRPSRIAVFAVDEGILQVTRYQTPQPLDHFLQKRALGVGTLQILDLILPEFDLVRALSAAGGGMADQMSLMLAQNLNPFQRKTDRPAVYWAGIVDADSELRELSFDVPETFSGQLRVMAVAVGESAVGAGSASSIVRGPFVISPNLLTAAAPGDEFEVTVGIANIIEGSGDNASVDLEISATDNLELVGETRQHLEIDEGGEGKYRFRARARDGLGAAEIRFDVSHADEDASRSASLSLRPANRYRTSLDSGYAADGKLDLELERKLLPQLSRQAITASSSPLAIVDGLTSYLDKFPHGCTEQVVSQVFPLVGLSAHPAFAPQLDDVEAHFARLIDKLRERQLGDGGFAFWPGQSQSAEYPSVYVMHFLLEANRQGVPVPGDMLQRGRDYLEGLSARAATSLGEARTRANAIYLLTRMGTVTTNYLVDLEESLEENHPRSWRRDLLSAYMAATYQMLQKTDTAARLIDGYRMNADDHRELDDFHSLLALDAQYLFLLSKHFPARARDLPGDRILQLTREVFEGRYNTISAAYTILALGAYSELVDASGEERDILFRAIDAAGQARQLQAVARPFMTADYGVDARRLEIEGPGPVFYLNQQAGYDAALPVEASSRGIEVYRDFIDDEGKVVTRYEQGKELIVRIRVRALGSERRNNVAIVDLLPGGFEVVRSSVSATARGWLADYIDIREDRVVYYGSFGDQVRELQYRVKLTSAGNFVVPSIYAESMYDRSVRAHTAPGRFEVIASE